MGSCLFLLFLRWRARKVAHFNRRLGIYGQVLVAATAGTLSRFFQQRPWCRGGAGEAGVMARAGGEIGVEGRIAMS